MNFLFVLLVVGFVSCKDALFENVDEELKEYLPNELRKFIEELSDKDKEALKETAQIMDEEKAIAHLKKTAPELGAKAEALYKIYTTKLESLKDEKANKFAMDVISGLKKVQQKYASGEEITEDYMKGVAKHAFDQFTALPENSKAELNKTFPKLIAYFQSKKFVKLVGEAKD